MKITELALKYKGTDKFYDAVHGHCYGDFYEAELLPIKTYQYPCWRLVLRVETEFGESILPKQQ